MNGASLSHFIQVDDIPLSRPKRNIARDFSDGGMLAVLPLSCLSLVLEANFRLLKCSADGGGSQVLLPTACGAAQLLGRQQL